MSEKKHKENKIEQIRNRIKTVSHESYKSWDEKDKEIDKLIDELLSS